MNFEDEEYIRVYVRNTATTKMLGWEGRTVLWHLERVVEKSGVLELEEGDDLTEVVAALCDLPIEITKLGLERLASRRVTIRHAASLTIVRFVEAQNAKRSDRLRAQDYRDRQKLEAQASFPEKAEEKPGASRGVTPRHDSSLLALPLPASPCLALPLPAEEGARAREAAPAPARGLARVHRPAPPNQQAAIALPLAERACLVLEDPGNAQWSRPQEWPEVVAVAEALAKAAGHKRPRLGDCSRDVGVKTVLQLFADGWPVGELTTLAGVVARSKWWREGGPKGLSSLTGEVLRRAQNAEAKREPQMDPEIAKQIAKTKAMAAEIGNGGT